MSERKVDVIELLVYLEPAVTYTQGVTLAEGLRIDLVRRGYSVVIADIRGEEDPPEADS